MDKNEFININKEVWKDFQNNEIKENMLVEAPYRDYLFITHQMAMQTLILYNAKGYKPMWLYNPDIPLNLLQSYVPEAEYIELKGIKKFKNIKRKISVIFSYLKILFTGNTLGFKYDGIKYGDILHDLYLCRYQSATLQKPNKKLLPIMHEITKLHTKCVQTIKDNNIKAFLVSHRISFPGVMLRCAIKCGCSVYVNNGTNPCCLFKSKGMDEMIEYAYTPTKKDVSAILAMDEERFDREFQMIHNNHLYGTSTCDAQYAYSDTNKMYKTRDEFNVKYGLDSSKKNIFVMLHAFTDHPHSHFNHMVFKDYGDWFLRTLEYAKKHNHVNWIFKQHPSDKFYPVVDLDFKKLFKDAPSNMVFLSSEDKVDTRSLENTADAIITCIGSAGFEIPALYAIPSFTAGDNPYMNFNFSKNLQTKEEYFNTLDNLDKITRLTAMQQKEAKAVYMFIYGYCQVPYSFIPDSTHESQRDVDANEKFFDSVIDIYKEQKNLIQNEVLRYSFEVSKPTFKALRNNRYKKLDKYEIETYDNYTKGISSAETDILDGLEIPYKIKNKEIIVIENNSKVSDIFREFMKNNYIVAKMQSEYGQTELISFLKDNKMTEIIFDKTVYDKITEENAVMVEK